MGITYIKTTVKDLSETKKVEAKFLVDTGAHYTLLPKEIVKKIGIRPTREQEFILADGRSVKRKMGRAIIQIDGHGEPTTVILGEKDDGALLGTITLEQMGLMIDPFNRKLRPVKALLI